jgi:hypothetical protein
VVVINDATRVKGAASTARKISVSDGASFFQPTWVYVDVARDRMYVHNINNQVTSVVTNASTANGTVTPAATLAHGFDFMTFGASTDTLYQASGATVNEFDNASAFSGTVSNTPSRSFTINDPNHTVSTLNGIAIDLPAGYGAIYYAP